MILFRMVVVVAGFRRAVSLLQQHQPHQQISNSLRIRPPWNYLSYITKKMTFTTLQLDKEQSVPVDGRLVARILPREYADYERHKPSQRRVEPVDVWRNRIVWPDNLPTTYPPAQESFESDIEDPIVALDIHLETRIFDTETKEYHIIQANMEMQREWDETAQRTLRRIEISSQRKIESAKHRYRLSKAQRRASSSTSTMDDSSSSIWVLDAKPSTKEDDLMGDDEDNLDGYRRLQFEEGTKNKDLWLSLKGGPKSRLWMDVLAEKESGITLDLEPCPPTVLWLQNFEDFAADVFVGVPLVIETRSIHAEHTWVIWFADEEQVSFDSHCYTPTLSDAGKTITAVISPIRNDQKYGHEEVYQFQKKVAMRPNLPILDFRADWLRRDDPQRSRDLRVMSYNLMADIHLNPEVERRARYAKCDTSLLTRTRRMPLLLYEILQHDADVICLQECDMTVYDQLFRPALAAHGYSGFYSNKATTQLEGCAMFWSHRLFEKDAEAEVYPIRDLFKEPKFLDHNWDSMSEIREFLRSMPGLREVVEENVGQILQVARLRLRENIVPCSGDSHLVVGNTHLFYHPMADHVRLMQAYVVCKKMDSWCRYDENDDLSRDQLLFCGDLNSDPKSGALRLLLERRVTPSDSDVWKNVDKYTWESSDSNLGSFDFGAEDSSSPSDDTPECDALSPLQPPMYSVDLPTIELPKSFPKLLLGYDPIPEFSNYVVGFAETLDYIFLSDASQTSGWTIGASAPIPSKAEMQCPAIPNEDYPSDHVSLACDLQWNGRLASTGSRTESKKSDE